MHEVRGQRLHDDRDRPVARHPPRWRWLESDPFAQRVTRASDQGALRVASIVFRPLAGEPNGTAAGYTRWKLLEW